MIMAPLDRRYRPLRQDLRSHDADPANRRVELLIAGMRVGDGCDRIGVAGEPLGED